MAWRNRDRDELRDLRRQNDRQQKDVIALSRYIFVLRQSLELKGIDTPEPPALLSQETVGVGEPR